MESLAGNDKVERVLDILIDEHLSCDDGDERF
jgi:hypothetical protein